MNLLTDLLTQFTNASQTWQAILVPYAQALFLLLAGLELVWTAIRYQLSSNQSITHLPELLIRKLVYLAFCFWLIRYSSALLPFIIASFQRAGGNAVGITALAPSAFLRAGAASGLRLTAKMLGSGLLVDPISRTIAFFTITFTIVAFALIAGAMTLVLTESLIAIGAIVFLLPFAATRWTHALAEGALGYVFRTAVKLFTMYLLAGTILNLATAWSIQVGDSLMTPPDLLVFAMSLVSLVILIWTIPGKIAHAVVPPSIRFGLTPTVGDN